MLKDILNFRRAVRYYAPTPISEEKVRECLRLATLAPTSSNMQLYELYHITNKELLKKLAHACLDQRTAATTAQQMVVFVTRQDKHRAHAKMILDFERGNVQRNSPLERQTKRIKDKEAYYGKLMPFVYSRFFGLLGGFRKLFGVVTSWFRPMMQQLSEGDIRVSVHKSCGLVAQTFMLAMAEEGYDTCPLEGYDSRRIKKLLHLPCRAEVSMVITCGIREERGIWGERFRLPFEKVYRNN
ncbi:nitroreductase family protein [Capnocytophaga sp. 051621]|uniref:Nitroreductase family protein n=1 Tax=Capnocytophaga periodontitidis TaxID=2795027 RepID=A0ABS0SR04_9FLAO|nr:nitroreductase family protein [Capnocytophaga periodontitidis]MBI1647912.1 nitroreductase family protein [Capnocytophaga periodontitidis]